MSRFAVESTVPGREDDFEEFDTYPEATAYADRLMNEWEEATGEEADRGWASRDNLYCGRLGSAGFVAVVRAEERS